MENPMKIKNAVLHSFYLNSALGAPGVFSRLDPYADVVTHGHDGLLA